MRSFVAGGSFRARLRLDSGRTNVHTFRHQLELWHLFRHAAQWHCCGKGHMCRGVGHPSQCRHWRWSNRDCSKNDGSRRCNAKLPGVSGCRAEHQLGKHSERRGDRNRKRECHFLWTDSGWAGSCTWHIHRYSQYCNHNVSGDCRYSGNVHDRRQPIGLRQLHGSDPQRHHNNIRHLHKGSTV